METKPLTDVELITLLSKEFPNNQEFGKMVRIYIKSLEGETP